MSTEVSSFVNICSKLDISLNNKLKKLVVSDLKTKVKTLSQLVSKQLDLNEDKFDLMCFGRILASDQTLEDYGITNGTTVFVLNKINLLVPSVDNKDHKPMASQSDIQHMVIALRTALMDASFRKMLDKLSESEFRENLMAVTPGLREDPTTFAILQDPDLLTTLTQPSNIHKVLTRHPCLLEAATYLSATFHEEIIANENTSGPSSASLLGRGSSAFSYSLDAMSDDEEMDETEMPAQPNTNSNTTARTLADMMVRAYQSNQSSSAQSSTSSGVITQDMLRQALEHSSTTPVIQPSTSSAINPSASVVSSASASASTSSTASRLRGWATQLQQLRDLGINDEIVAIQALEATNGDVQQAINIIFSDNN